MSTSTKVKVQEFGRFLSSMIMPNIGAFIAWGFITALFIPTGWIPNEHFAKLVGPMITYLLPLLIGYTGGTLVHGVRGGVVGAITTMGVIIGSDIPMFMGAMMVGPLGGYAIKKFDNLVDGKIKTGFEMLVNNFSAGIIGMILALIALVVVGPIVAYLNHMLGEAVNVLVNNHLLLLVSIIVEPAKILFLNNAINHGVFSPLGLEQSAEIGKSIFFLIESNPGPGLGVLLAYMVFEKQDSIRQSAVGASIIHFFGGIHEIYFPYVLMRPILILALIAGGMSGVFTFTLLNGGLIAPPSPGSIIALLAMTPKGGFLTTIIGISVATGVSFVVSSFLIKYTNSTSSLEEANEQKNSMKSTSSSSNLLQRQPQVIVFACDAGMGSSAMGASLLRGKLKTAGLSIKVINKAINNLSSEDSFIITQNTLTERAKKKIPNAYHLSIDNFMNGKFYDELIIELKTKEASTINSPQENIVAPLGSSNVLNFNNIKLGLASTSKMEAIKYAGQLLVESGYVKEGYVNAMLERESLATTFIGSNTAIPHGTNEAKDEVIESGIVVLQFPEGVNFDGNIANLIIGIAGKNNTHMDILANIANTIQDEEIVKKLIKTKDVNDFIINFNININ
ncbi:MAG: PTS mannitol transporter subunit IICBA [Alphaproteobacteria bacterium]|jgi:PTS system mannitol-specific IIC component|nr:PTS mannitol transporter subunit IICBA [Alphaproteobacteria bacterium]